MRPSDATRAWQNIAAVKLWNEQGLTVLRGHPVVRCGLLCAFALAASLSGVPGASGQSRRALDADEYTALIRQYRSGAFQTATAVLARWPPERLRDVIRRVAPPTDVDATHAKAAIMLHSDVAILLAALDQRLSEQHVDAARKWLRGLSGTAAATFKDQWHAYAAWPSLVRHDLRQATLAVRQGIAAFPRSTDLQVMQGVLRELAARSETSDFRGDWRAERAGDQDQSDRRITRIESGLAAATVAYQRALDLDPSSISARLRLGWVLAINNSHNRARAHLELVVGVAASAEQRYLSHLILGGLAEQDGQPGRALEAYRAAHAVHPRAQTAHIAFMRAAQVAGDAELARRLFAEYAAAVPWIEDPWWAFSMGLDSDLAVRLRADASQR